MDDLATKSNRLILRKALHSLPPNLSKSYQIIWDRIQSQLDDDRKLATRVLLWVGHAFGPLSLEALQHAIAIQAEPQVSAIDEASLDAEEILLDVCKGLIYIHDEDGTVGLVRELPILTEVYIEYRTSIHDLWFVVVLMFLQISQLKNGSKTIVRPYFQVVRKPWPTHA